MLAIVPGGGRWRDAVLLANRVVVPPFAPPGVIDRHADNHRFNCDDPFPKFIGAAPMLKPMQPFLAPETNRKILESLVIRRMFGCQEPLALEYAPNDELALLEAKIAAMSSSFGKGAGGVPGFDPIGENVGGYGNPKAKDWRIHRPGDAAPNSADAHLSDLIDKVTKARRKGSKTAFHGKPGMEKKERARLKTWKGKNQSDVKAQKKRRAEREHQDALNGEIFTIDGEGVHTGETFCDGAIILKTQYVDGGRSRRR